MIKWYKFIALLLFISIAAVVKAKVKLPQFFSNNMVLQRDMPIHIWGWAERGETVIISFNGVTENSKADKNRKWEIHLPAMTYGGPFTMSIKGADNAIVFDNILIGDVWICSGQSNMEVRLAEDYTAEDEIKASENKNIRLLKIPTNIQTEEKDDIPETAWMDCNPLTSKDFSAVAYFFGKNLQKDLNVPIGLILSAWGGTVIETWTSWEASMNNDSFAKFKGKSVEESFGHSGEELNDVIRSLMSPNDIGMRDKWYLAHANSVGWKTMYAPKTWDGELKGDAGIVWFKKQITLPDEIEGKTGLLHLGLSSLDRPFFNGEFVGLAPEENEVDNFDPKVKARGGVNHIVVRFQEMGGGGGFSRSQPNDFYLEVAGKKYSLAGDWEYKPSLLQSQTGLKSWGVGIPNNFASLLYNGMIHPLVGLGIKGAIWYQGEGNAGEAFKYRTLLPNLITDWRKQWGYNFPFFWVQLASFYPVEAEPGESAWAELREAQNMTFSLPNTGQAVITDIGDINNIHPRNKKVVGYRLAQSALKVAYGKNVLGSGPVYNTMTVVGDKVILHFSNTGTTLTTSEKNKYGYVYGFSIAGDDKEFFWAKAYIEGDNIIVFSDKVANPVAVRYGWAMNPTEINLVNSDGLLASPFRTDSWKGITEH